MKAHNPAFPTLRPGAVTRHTITDGVKVVTQAWPDSVTYRAEGSVTPLRLDNPLYAAGGVMSRSVTGPYRN